MDRSCFFLIKLSACNNFLYKQRIEIGRCISYPIDSQKNNNLLDFICGSLVKLKIWEVKQNAYDILWSHSFTQHMSPAGLWLCLKKRRWVQRGQCGERKKQTIWIRAYGWINECGARLKRRGVLIGTSHSHAEDNSDSSVRWHTDTITHHQSNLYQQITISSHEKKGESGTVRKRWALKVQCAKNNLKRNHQYIDCFQNNLVSNSPRQPLLGKKVAIMLL